jgi:hypothetical protein
MVFSRQEGETYRLIITIIYINKVIIYDANISFNINKFFKEFIKYIVASLLNIFSDYN